MFRRLGVGLLIGLIVGGLLAAGIVAGLKITAFEGAGGIALAYLSAAVAGIVTGLFAGKPIWAAEAKIEGGLKAFFGALIALGVMFALRQWAAGVQLDLTSWGDLGRGSVGNLPAASLPAIAGVLGALFELDNTGGGARADKKSGELPTEARKRVSAPRANGKAKVPAEESDEVASAADGEGGAKRARR